ncbi:MAG: trypsin-like serine protease [Deltaproteobacteria bacterium]|nr:trypsin-like serine protease [Deltaproteobacteria bacterium]
MKTLLVLNLIFKKLTKIAGTSLVIISLFLASSSHASPLQPGLSLTTDTRESRLENGDILSASQARRSGIYAVASGGSWCTATVLYTSATFNKTWVITAGHCMENDDGSFRTSAKLYAAMAGQNSPPNQNGLVFVHSNFRSPQDDHRHDIALVLFNYSLNIETPSGEVLHEYYRPIASSNPSEDTMSPFGRGAVTGGEPNIFCNYEERTNDSTLRWATGDYQSNGNGRISIDALFSQSGVEAYLAPGDSGGPWLVNNNSSINDLLDNGVVGGIWSGWDCSFGNSTFWASSTWGTINNDFISTTMGSDLVQVDADTWTRTCWEDWCYLPDMDADGVFDDVDNCPNSSNASQLDTDNDGQGNACDDDDDGDGLLDTYEVNTLGTDPLNPDTDGDGLSDTVEWFINSDPTNPDTDGDGLNDYDEIYLYETDPREADTDGDGLMDGEEVSQGIDPLNNDSDGDGLLDNEEAIQGTDPLNSDTDGDGVEDLEEINGGRNPTVHEPAILIAVTSHLL